MAHLLLKATAASRPASPEVKEAKQATTTTTSSLGCDEHEASSTSFLGSCQGSGSQAGISPLSYRGISYNCQDCAAPALHVITLLIHKSCSLTTVGMPCRLQVEASGKGLMSMQARYKKGQSKSARTAPPPHHNK